MGWSSPQRSTGCDRDRIDGQGRVTLGYRGELRHIAVGRAHAGTRVLLLVADLDVRVVTTMKASSSGS